jgi:hypothetical protein
MLEVILLVLLTRFNYKLRMLVAPDTELDKVVFLFVLKKLAGLFSKAKSVRLMDSGLMKSVKL